MMTENQPPQRLAWKRLLILALALCGVGLATVLTRHHRDINYSSFLVDAVCGAEGSGCDVVNRSAAARLFGIPLAQWGFYYYSSLFLIGLTSLIGSRQGLLLGFYACLAGALIDVGLLFYSVFVLGTICNLCLLTYLITFSLLFFFWRTVKTENIGFSLQARRFSPKKLLENTPILTTVGLGALAIFTTGGYLSAMIRPVEEQYRDLLQDPDEALFVAWSAFYKSYRNSEQVLPDTQGSPEKGSRQPVLRMTLFADFSCPHCRRATRFLGDIVDRHRDKVSLVYKHYPLDHSCNCKSDSVHVGACKLARASYAAHRQGKFWYFHDLMYANQHMWKTGVSDEQILGIVAKTGFDLPRFKEEMSSPEAAAWVQRDIELANQTDLVTATPALFINGKRMNSIPLGEFIEELITMESEEKFPFGFAPAELIDSNPRPTRLSPQF